MELTGKTKIEFQEWFPKYCEINLKEEREDFADDEEMLKAFYENLLDAMKYGVYEDYFESIGIIFLLEPLRSGEWAAYIGSKGLICQNKQLARTAAIEKANEIRNRELN